MKNSNKPTQRTTTENVVYYRNQYKYNSLQKINEKGKMHGSKRVATFCFMIMVLPAMLIILPLYLRHVKYADVAFSITESDIMEIKSLSTIFCQQHSLKMNTSFNAFQINNKPEIAKNRKHIRLKKSMILPDDTLEFWGFYLLKGATVKLKVCSRFDGSHILVVKGERNLQTCGFLENHKNNIDGIHMAKNQGEVVFVTFETVAEEIHSNDNNNDIINNNNRIKNEEDDIENNSNNASEDFSDNNSTIIFNKIKTNKYNKTISSNDSKNSAINKELKKNNFDRNKRDLIIDRKINHGGNAINFTEKNSDSESESSFENFLKCYDGKIISLKKFDPSEKCTNVSYFEDNTIAHITAIHDVIEDGYYYYIFYSDNDDVKNDIHAVFDILKPTYLYANISESKGCINKTECTFSLNFWSDETIIVEVPTKNGIEEDDETILISSCHPRMGIYVIFPIAVLFLILTCAFL